MDHIRQHKSCCSYQTKYTWERLWGQQPTCFSWLLVGTSSQNDYALYSRGAKIENKSFRDRKAEEWISILILPSHHWGRVMHICVSKLTINGSDNGLSPCWRQAIIWTHAGILLIGHLGTNFSEILIEIHTFSFKKIELKMSSGKWRPSCLGLNVLTHPYPHYKRLRQAKSVHF